VKAEDRDWDEQKRLNAGLLDVSAWKHTVIGNDVWTGVNACVIGGKDLRIGHSGPPPL
jgi:acetyltransferase-like isoleucine patch superfamily enzyme